MTTDDLGSVAPDRDPLTAIEALVHRARSGELSEADALAKIATLVRTTGNDTVYQKPWG